MRPHPFAIELHEQRSGRRTLVVRGELDMSTAPRLIDAAAALLEDAERGISIDISRLDFLDSAGMHAILAIKAASEVHQFDLELTRGSPQVERVFAITRVIDRLPFPRSRPHGHADAVRQIWPPEDDAPSVRLTQPAA